MISSLFTFFFFLSISIEGLLSISVSSLEPFFCSDELFSTNIDTRDQEDIFNSVLKKYNELYSNGFGTVAETYATETLDALKGIFYITDLEVRTNLLNSIHENGMLTAEGIDDTIEAIEEIEGLSSEDKEALIKEFTEVK